MLENHAQASSLSSTVTHLTLSQSPKDGGMRALGLLPASTTHVLGSSLHFAPNVLIIKNLFFLLVKCGFSKQRL